MDKLKKPFKLSIRKNMILSFFLMLVIAGVSLNFIFQYIIKSILASEGLNSTIIENVTGYFAIAGSGVTIIGIVIALLVAFICLTSITRPIEELTRGVIDLAKGQWATRIKVTSQNEIGQLAEGFNFMAENVENALQQLKAAKEYTDNIVVSVPSMLIILSEKLNVLSSNIAFENLSEQFPTLSLRQFIAPLEKEIKINLDTGETLKKEIIIIPEGSDVKLFFSATVSLIGYEDDEVDELDEKARILLTITDITERRKMREMVLQSKQDWEDTFNTIPDAITVHDQHYNIIYANIAAKKMLDLSDVMHDSPKKCFQYYHGKEAAPADCPSCKCLHTKMPATFETYEPHLKKYIELRSIPRINKENNVVGLIHIVRDISKRKKIEEDHSNLLIEVTKAKLEWEMTFDSVNEFILFIDRDLHITRCNKSFSDYAGLPVEELTGYKCHDFFPCSTEFFENINDKANSGNLFIKKEIKTETGKWLYISHRPVFDENNKYTFSVILATDITELKKAQERIEESEDELKIKIKDLEKFYDMAVGRELRMKDLKKEITRLNIALSNYEEQHIVNRQN